MNIHEFEAKALLAARGIAIPQGKVATDPATAHKVAGELGGTVVVKAQIHAGGRGKGHVVGSPDVHGVKVCKTHEAARDHAAALLGHKLLTHQTGPDGQRVKRVLVEKASNIARELYVGITLDRSLGRMAFIASTEGGMDIEHVAATTPDKLVKQAIDPVSGMMPFVGRKLCAALGLSSKASKQAGQLLQRLYQTCLDVDASLLEVNPLVVTGDDDMVALDAKINIDDNALYRQPNIAALRDLDEEDSKERDARDAGLSYVALNGNIGCLVNGAGLAMATMDIIKLHGGTPANFLDVGGSATTEMVTRAFKIILADPQVRAILVNIFGGIARCDVIANGVVAAAKEVGLSMPLVVRLEGTNVELGKKILAGSGLSIVAAQDMLDAATKVVAAAGGQR